MSQLASKNMQKENVDVYNFWKWPTSYYSGGTITPNMSISKSALSGKWLPNVSPNGYLLFTDPKKYLLSFDSTHMTASRHYGYAVGTFLDLQPGKYVMEYDVAADITIIDYITRYARMPDADDQYMYSDYQYISLRNSCHSSREFTIEDGYMYMWWAAADSIEGDVATFTNIKIREGIL